MVASIIIISVAVYMLVLAGATTLIALTISE